MTRRRRRFDEDDRAQSIHQYVSIDVPPNTDALSVEIDFDRDRAIVDLGVFGPGDTFRGYSGGARRRFDITERWATPGYLPGELDPGEWRVLLGLYVVPASGVEVEVRWQFDQPAPEPDPGVPPAPDRPPRRRLPAAPGRRWLACDFHAHTRHSDGELSIGALAALAASNNLDALAVTDHNTVSHHPHLPGISRTIGIDLIPGQEVTTDTGHANAFGPIPWVDFRHEPDEWLAAVDEGGGLLSINHPLAGHCAWRRPDLPGAHLVEMWHSTWDRESDLPIEWWRRHGGTPIGGSDFHRMSDPERPGYPTTWVETSDGNVLEALREGRVAISAAPDAPVAVAEGDEVHVVDGDGLSLVTPDGRPNPVDSARHTIRVQPGLHELVDPGGRVVAVVDVSG